MSLQDEFKAFLQEKGLKQAQVARSLGVSASLISQWLKGNYNGDVEAFESKIKYFIQNFNKLNLSISEEIHKTNDMKMVFFTLDESIVSKEMSLIYGEAGSGKTTAIKEYIKRHPEAILIEVVPGMSTKSLLKAICEKANISGVSTNEEMIDAISREFSRREALLIVDEAENLTTRTLESIRRIWDFSRVPVCFVGTYNVVRNLKGRNGELLQLYSRINGKWEMQGLKEEEWELFFGGFADEIKKYTKHLRRAVSIYKKAKRLASLSDSELNAGFIEAASSMVILD